MYRVDSAARVSCEHDEVSQTLGMVSRAATNPSRPTCWLWRRVCSCVMASCWVDRRNTSWMAFWIFRRADAVFVGMAMLNVVRGRLLASSKDQIIFMTSR